MLPPRHTHAHCDMVMMLAGVSSSRAPEQCGACGGVQQQLCDWCPRLGRKSLVAARNGLRGIRFLPAPPPIRAAAPLPSREFAVLRGRGRTAYSISRMRPAPLLCGDTHHRVRIRDIQEYCDDLNANGRFPDDHTTQPFCHSYWHHHCALPLTAPPPSPMS